MNRRSLLLVAALALAALPAAEASAQGVLIPLPSRAAPPPSERTSEPPPPPAIAPFLIPGAPARRETRQAPAQPQAPQTIIRPIVPLGSVRMTGETDSLAWRIAVTPAEAEAASGLQVGYTNAVVVMPEGSRLRIFINGELAYNNPIASAGGLNPVTVPLRKGLLKAGDNLIRLEALQRHRVDCTIRGTYELWTDIDGPTTGLVLAGDMRKTIGGLHELPMVGFDATGATTIEIVTPNSSRPEARDRVLRAAQAVAIRGRYAHPIIRIAERVNGSAPVGTLRVVVAPGAELAGIMPSPPADAATRPYAGLVTPDRSTDSILLISGPTFAEIDRAIATVAASSPPGEEATTVPTSAWSAPDAPLVLNGREISFAQVGIPSTEFSGRRLTFRFLVALPGDFFASDYAEARLYLDAATTPAVRNGSRIDIYVNGNTTATAPVVDRRSFQRYPVRLGMGQFKPGLNTVTIEAVLVTDADEQCAPGGTMPGVNRIVIYDSTSLWIPRFARIGRRPDLAAVAAGDYPRNDSPVAVVLPRVDPESFASAGTVLARIARDSGRIIPVRAGTSSEVTGTSTMFVGAIGQLPPQALEQVGFSANARQNWTITPPPEPSREEATRTASADPAFTLPVRPRGLSEDPFATSSPAPNGDLRNRWSENGGESQIMRAVGSIGVTFSRVFDGITGAFRRRPAAPASYDPPQGVSLVLAEGRNPDGTGSWLVVTSPSDQGLREGVGQITHPRAWMQVKGRISGLQPVPELIRSQPITTFSFVPTVGLGPGNLRLIAANWLSTNLLPYALLVLMGCFGLGLATHLLVGRLGRRG